MEFRVSINVMPRAEISDPQGQAVERALPGLGFNTISGLRVGKRITMRVAAADQESAADIVTRACNKILANPVIEDFTFEIEEESERSPALKGAQV